MKQVLGALFFLLHLGAAQAADSLKVRTDGVTLTFGGLFQVVTFSPLFFKGFSSKPGPDFELGRAQLSVSVEAVPEKVWAYLMVDPAASPRQPVEDLYFSIGYVPKSRFRIGQFKLPFGREGSSSDGELDFVRRASVSDTFFNRRDVGAEYRLDLPRFFALASAFNGTGKQTIEDNDFKDWVLRAVGEPIRGVQIGGSFFAGKKNGRVVSPRPGATLLQLLDFYRYGLEATVLKGGWKVQSEMIYARDDRFLIDSAFVRLKRWGGYVSLLQSPWPKHRFGLRGDWLDNDIRVGRNTTFQATFGYTFQPTKAARLQVDYLAFSDQKGRTARNNVLHQIFTNWQISF